MFRKSDTQAYWYRDTLLYRDTGIYIWVKSPRRGTRQKLVTFVLTLSINYNKFSNSTHSIIHYSFNYCVNVTVWLCVCVTVWLCDCGTVWLFSLHLNILWFFPPPRGRGILEEYTPLPLCPPMKYNQFWLVCLQSD